MPVNTPHTRDAGLFQLNRMNRWLIAGSVFLTGVLAEVAAHAFPGKTTSSAGAHRARSSHAGTPTTTTQTPAPLAAPEQPPASGEEQAPSEEAPPSTQEPQPQESQPAPETRSEVPQQESQPAPEAPAPAEQERPREEGPIVSGGS
jgi:outer membrane biosynthesis protein TonB